MMVKKSTTFKGAPKPFGASGHFNESRRHSLQARGIKTGRNNYRIFVRPEGGKKLIPTQESFDDEKEAETFAGVETIAGMGETYIVKKDTDGDGVPDTKDCDPNDPTKQDSPQQKERADKLWQKLKVPLLKGEEIEKNELYLFAINDGELYRMRRKPVEEMLWSKMKKGTYNSKLALLSFKLVADEGAKKYYKEFGGKDYFTPRVRAWVAKEMLEDFEAEPSFD